MIGVQTLVPGGVSTISPRTLARRISAFPPLVSSAYKREPLVPRAVRKRELDLAGFRIGQGNRSTEPTVTNWVGVAGELSFVWVRVRVSAFPTRLDSSGSPTRGRQARAIRAHVTLNPVYASTVAFTCRGRLIAFTRFHADGLRQRKVTVAELSRVQDVLPSRRLTPPSTRSPFEPGPGSIDQGPSSPGEGTQGGVRANPDALRRRTAALPPRRFRGARSIHSQGRQPSQFLAEGPLPQREKGELNENSTGPKRPGQRRRSRRSRRERGPRSARIEYV